ncbi:DUF2278 family protein [Dactylosporangium fulvum]|uniref:YukJ family protein n=1 Tax=Dactylosporangium fulvum TaxID=53359 RepID=A0ABY5W1Q9_9ACTN|nr:YukJ family protein [Dactylosporangium fulvum]UWP83041.1 YukJ family protein [Dactylosporangium fulvum]
MPLDRYGVLIGTLTGHHRDTPDDQGRWFHVNLDVTAPAGRYRCAVDVDSKQTTTGVQWRTSRIHPAQLPVLTGLAAGFRPLPMTAAGGAVDYLRHPAFRPGIGCVFVRPPDALTRWLEELLRNRSWRTGSNLDAATALESILVVGARVAIFGEPFTNGLGVHNVHQNQGDPPGSQWWAENGTWQDGATLVYRPDGQLDVFQNKFTSQAFQTDDQGHPT